jgi:hypothetical protein
LQSVFPVQIPHQPLPRHQLKMIVPWKWIPLMKFCKYDCQSKQLLVAKYYAYRPLQLDDQQEVGVFSSNLRKH